VQLLILAKRPVAGRAKTRLMPAFGPEGSAALAAAALADTFDAATRSSAERVVVSFDGDPTGVVPDRFDVVPQCDGDLATRLTHAWASLTGPALQIGMDTPQLTGADLDAAFASLAQPGMDAALGLAEDGGWWALGLRRPADVVRRVFAGIATSRADTGTRQLARLHHLGLATATLPVQRDVDLPADALAVAAAAPHTRFARTVDELMATAGAQAITNQEVFR